jgi:hypothetical protein
MTNNIITFPFNTPLPQTDILVPIFDGQDLEYLATILSIPQLRMEIKHSEMCECYHGGCVDYNISEVIYEREYQDACKKAIDIIRSHQPKPTITNSKFIDIDSLKSLVDITAIAERYTKLVKAGKNFKALCPFHSEKQPSFMVYPDKQSWHCFGACSTGGDVISLVMKAENTDFKGAIALLGGKY